MTVNFLIILLTAFSTSKFLLVISSLYLPQRKTERVKKKTSCRRCSSKGQATRFISKKLKLQPPPMRLITVDYESELFNYHRTSSKEGWAPIERVQFFLCERTVKGLNPGVFSLFLC